MRLAIVSQQGGKASGAEHALLQFLCLLPRDVELHWFFLEDGEFAAAIRRRFSSVMIVKMSDRVATAQRGSLPLSAIADSAAVTIRLSRSLARARPDAVVTNSMKAHIVGSLAAKLAGLRCLNYVHDIVDGGSLALLRVVSRLCAVERLTCSTLVKEHLRLPQTTVAYAAIDVAQFAQLPNRSEARRTLGLPGPDIPVIGLVGRIARWKRQDRFIRTAAAVLAQQDAHFCIVGSPIFGCDMVYVDELKADISRRGLTDRVTFVPWQDNMPTVYAALDIACNCSDREPFGRTSLEALASGVPIVCFDDAGVCEIFEQHQGGIRVSAGDEDAFAAAVISYLRAPAMLATARVRARHTAEQMDISRAYAVFAQAIARVADVPLRVRDERQRATSVPIPGHASNERQTNTCLVK